MEVIGTVIEAADVIIEMVDTIAKIHPVFDVSWQATSALYKVVSQQFHTDKELHGFVARMSRIGSGQKISDYSARFVDLRKELDSVISLNTAKEVLDIKSQQQLEALLEPFKSDASNAWDDSVRVLCDVADGLFIWASTAVKMVRSPGDRRRNLQQLVDDIRSLGEYGLYDLYAIALNGSRIWQSNLKDVGTTVLGLILVAKEALTGAVIECFLGLEEDTVDPILRQLQSVILYEPGRPVRLHHASFADYLLSSQRSDDNPWHIDEIGQKQTVAERCFEIMAENLRFNICNIESSFFRNEDVPDLRTRIATNIYLHLDYACRFWAVHLCDLSNSAVSAELKDRMKSFGKEHLLHWLEVLSLTGQFARIAIRALYDASMWSASIDEEIYYLFWAAYRLASVFAYPISQSVPHIYLSAISLWKGESLIADYYAKTHPIIKVDRLGMRAPGQCIKILKGHTDDINSITVSHDGGRIASGSRDKTIRVWSAFSGELIADPFEVDDAVRSVAFSSDGKQVVSGSRGGTIHVWDVDTGSPVSVFEASDSKLTSVAFSPDSRRVISVSDGKVFYFENDELVSAQFEDDMNGDDYSELFSARSGDDKDVKFRQITPDGKYVLGSKDSMIGIWNTGTGKRVSAPFNVGNVQLMAISPDGKYLATISYDAKTSALNMLLSLAAGGKRPFTDTLREICIWNIGRGELVKTVFSHGRVSSLAFSPDEKRIVSSFGKWISILDVDSGRWIWGPFREYTWDLTSVIFTPDGKRVISGSADNTIRIWDVGGSTKVASGGLEAHTFWVRSVAYSPDGRHIVSGSDDNTIRIWDADSGKHLVGPFKGHTDIVESVTFSPDGKRVLSGSRDRTIRIWNAESGELLAGPFEAHVERAGRELLAGQFAAYLESAGLELATERHRCSVTSVAFSPDGMRFVSPSCDNTICIRDTDSGRRVSSPFKGHTKQVLSVAYSPDGRYVMSGSRDKSICIWDVHSGKLVLEPLKGHTDDVNSVTFSPNGKRVVSGSEDRTICIWDAGTGELALGPLRGHSKGVASVCFSPDGKCVVSGSLDKTIRIWGADTGELVLGPLEGHTGPVDSVAISADGTRIVSGSSDSTIRVWNVGSEGIVPGCGGRFAKKTVATSSSSHRVDAHTGSNVQGTGPAASRERTLSNWILSEDGWVKGEGGELLVWIPEDMRDTLWRARNTAFFSTKFSLRLNLLDSPVGEDWARGYPKYR
ncbi:hypothetical protein ACEPAG_7476 [Sanghuangporus baumii]